MKIIRKWLGRFLCFFEFHDQAHQQIETHENGDCFQKRSCTRCGYSMEGFVKVGGSGETVTVMVHGESSKVSWKHIGAGGGGGGGVSSKATEGGGAGGVGRARHKEDGRTTARIRQRSRLKR